MVVVRAHGQAVGDGDGRASVIQMELPLALRLEEGVGGVGAHVAGKTIIVEGNHTQ